MARTLSGLETVGFRTNGSARAVARKFRASPTLTGGGGVERISACHGQRDSEVQVRESEPCKVDATGST